MTDVPFAIGEEFASKWQFLPYLERGITQFARIDVCNVGGLTEAMKVASLAESHYIDLMPHNPLGPICTAATVHLAAAVPNFAWLEHRVTPTEAGKFMDEDLFPMQCELVGSMLKVPEGAGARRGVQRRAGQGTGVQVLGSAAFAPPGWVAYELVMTPGAGQAMTSPAHSDCKNTFHGTMRIGPTTRSTGSLQTTSAF